MISLSYRAEDRNVCKRLLRAYYLNSLLACELARLRKILLLCKSSTLAEKDLKSFLSNVYVTCGSFNNKFC